MHHGQVAEGGVQHVVRPHQQECNALIGPHDITGGKHNWKQGRAEHVHLKRMYAWPITGMSKWEYGARISTWQLASSQVSLAAPSASPLHNHLVQTPAMHICTDSVQLIKGTQKPAAQSRALNVAALLGQKCTVARPSKKALTKEKRGGGGGLGGGGG